MRRRADNPHFRAKHETRSQRKAAWMRVKNGIAKDLDGQGVFVSRHVFEEPMAWVMVSFLSQKHKGIVLSAMLRTLDFVEWNNDGDVAEKVLDERGEGRRKSTLQLKEAGAKAYICSMFNKSDEERAIDDAFHERLEAARAIENAKPRLVSPKILIDEWGSVRVGIEAEVDAASLNPAAVLAFIKTFRELGEPITNKWTWQGAAVEVLPARLKSTDFSNGVTR